ncbi:hypothetical protein AB0L35_35400 [Streptomyces sp. NPDC052309]|uniref:hypothetical protein n=1 Tax=Streptomyces sp. NPDC052309 TaxID=3155421 RepID=UPI00343A48A0
MAPENLPETSQRYEPDTGILVTELRTATGMVRLTDALALRSGADLTDETPAGREELVCSAVVRAGAVRLRVGVEPRGGERAPAVFGGLDRAQIMCPAPRRPSRRSWPVGVASSGIRASVVRVTPPEQWNRQT